MAYPTRNTSTYTLPNQNTGVLLKDQDGGAILTEAGYEILLEDPSQIMNFATRNASSYSLPPRS